MPRKIAKKVYKVKRKLIDESKDNFVIKFKGLDKQEIRALRAELDECCRVFMTPAEEAPVQERRRSEY